MVALATKSAVQTGFLPTATTPRRGRPRSIKMSLTQPSEVSAGIVEETGLSMQTVLAKYSDLIHLLIHRAAIPMDVHEDVFNHCYTYILEHLPRFDSNKGQASTWLYNQIRGGIKDWRRVATKDDAHTAFDLDGADAGNVEEFMGCFGATDPTDFETRQVLAQAIQAAVKIYGKTQIIGRNGLLRLTPENKRRLQAIIIDLSEPCR